MPLARALVAGGLPAIEVTLRTAAAVAAIERIAAEVPDAVVGAGTVRQRAQVVARASAAGARFLVSPGGHAGAARRAGGRRRAVPPRRLDGVRGDRRCSSAGIGVAKLFPAEAVGGIATLRRSRRAVPASVRFCPTGGIDATKAPAYLALPNVACVGGSWMLPPAAVRTGDWATVKRLARAAAALGDPRPAVAAAA